MTSDNTDDLTNKLCNAILLTSQSAIVLQQHTQRLPPLFLQLVTLAASNQSMLFSLKTASDWLSKTLQNLERTAWQKVYFQQSITDVSQQEAELLNWAIEHGLQRHEALLQLFLEVGLKPDDLKALEKIAHESSSFPELLPFLELMLMTYVLTSQVNLDFQHLLALAKTVMAYRD